MTWDRIEQQWIVTRGPIQEQWTRLSDSDMEEIHGKRERLVGRIQELYGVRRADAERQVDRFLHGY